MRFIVIFLLIPLGGCAEWQEQRDMQRLLQEQAVEQAADAKCQSYGVKPGSSAYVQCRMNLDNQAAADLQQRRALAASLLLR